MSAGRGDETSIRGSPHPPLEELEEAAEEQAAEELEADEEDPEPPVEVNKPPTARFSTRKCG